MLTIRRDPAAEPEILYDPQPRQDALHDCKARNILYGGQAGGGKSHGLRWHGIKAGAYYKRLKILLLRRQFKDLERHHLLNLAWEIPPELARYNAGNHMLHFPKTQSVLVFGHCQHESDISNYLSSEWDIILIDEASEFTPRMLRMLRFRVRTTNPNIQPQFILGTNPGGEGHLWIKQRFLTHDPPKDEERNYNPQDWVFIESRLEDNEYLDANEYDLQFSSMTDAEYKAFRKGDWEAFAGQFFSDWRRALHMIPIGHELHQPPEEWYEIMGCMDWGWNPNPGYVAWNAYSPIGGAIGYKEFTFTELEPIEVCAGIVERSESEAERKMAIIYDPSMNIRRPTTRIGPGVSIATEMNETFQEMGVEIVMLPGNNDRLLGWQRFKNVLRPTRRMADGRVGPFQRFLEYNEETGLGCPYLINTIGAQMYDDKQNGDMKKGATDHGCFVAGTLIQTAAGPRAIEAVRGGEFVLTRYGYRRVVRAGCSNPEAQIFELRLSNGQVLRGTGDHPIWVEEQGWKPLAALTYGDTLALCVSRSSPSTVSNSGAILTELSGQSATTSLQAEQTERAALVASIKNFGKRYTDRFRSAVRSTIATAIRSITRLRTWNASLSSNITSATLMALNGLAATRVDPTWRRYDQRQSNGIGVRRHVKSIDAPHTKAGMLDDLLHEPVRDALSPSTAPGNVLGSVRRIVKLDITAPVYNLSVEGAHEYYANGVLVHNCDAWRYLTLHREPLVDTPRDLTKAPTHDERRLTRTRQLLAQAQAMHNEGLAVSEELGVSVIDEDQAMEIADLWN